MKHVADYDRIAVYCHIQRGWLYAGTHGFKDV